MRCSKCGNDNREGRKFCTSCGTPLVATCPKCSAPVQPGERFCGECGAAIGASAPRDPSSACPSTPQLNDAIPATEVIDGERKTVTALFADIKASMELMEDLDLHPDYPHYRPQNGARRQSVNLTMFSDRRGGLISSVAKRGGGGWL